MGGQEEGGCGGVIMKQIKLRSRTERVLRTTTYVVLYAFQSKTELTSVFQRTGTLVPFGIPEESNRKDRNLSSVQNSRRIQQECAT